MSGTVIIVYNPANKLSSSVHKDIYRWLSERSYRVQSFDSHQSRPRLPEVDFAISLGGDGTFLSCARFLSAEPVPILPVHLGTFGFITEVKHTEWQETLGYWLKGVLAVEERMLLKVEVLRSSDVKHSCIAVNDAVISSGSEAKLVDLILELGGFEMGHFRGDGVILSTATGSTAYSMAAGGPIMVPSMNALILTPICPFSLSWRPMVIPHGDEVIIRMDKSRQTVVNLSLDGQENYVIDANTVIRIKGLEAGMKVIKSEKRMFYEVVRSKLGWSGVVNA